MASHAPILPEAAVAEIAAGQRSEFLHVIEGDGAVAPWKAGDRIPLLEPYAAYWGARHPGGALVHGFDVPQSNGTVARATPEDPVHIHYKADAAPDGPDAWKPAAGMPDWAVRIVLGVSEVRLTSLRTLHRETGPGMGFDDWLDATMPGSAANWPEGTRAGPDSPVARVSFETWHAPRP